MPQFDPPTPTAGRSRVASRVATAWKGLPHKLRLAVLTASVLLFGVTVYELFFSTSATLNLVCRHNLRSAELSVFVDGRLVHTEQISGAAKKRFGLLDTRIEGSFSKALGLPAGRHVVKVRLRSPVDGFDQTKLCGVNLLAGRDATIIATTQRGGMSLAYEGPPVAAASEMASGYFNSLQTLLVTIAGSAMSAAIGFVVQEALRSRKAPSPVQNQSS